MIAFWPMVRWWIGMVTEHDAKQNMSLVTQEMPAPGEGQDVQEPLQVSDGSS
jgi:hypothetical protein